MRTFICDPRKIEDRVEKHPDDVDEMPVEAGGFDRRVIFGCERAARRAYYQHAQHARPIIMWTACRPVMTK